MESSQSALDPRLVVTRPDCACETTLHQASNVRASMSTTSIGRLNFWFEGSYLPYISRPKTNPD
jgi:hypothetical protein